MRRDLTPKRALRPPLGSLAKRKIQLGIGLIVLLITFIYGWTLLSASDGRPVAPLDDAYIHFQYARQIARGHPWQYNDGDPPSTGATSPLYPLLLAVGYLLGFSGERLVWFALGLGVISLGLSAWLIYRITARLMRRFFEQDLLMIRWAPAGAAIFFLLTGAVQWTYLSGMESGLFTVLILAALDTFIGGSETHDAGCGIRPAFWIALAALMRPEGLILAGVLWLVVVGRSIHYAVHSTQYPHGTRNTPTGHAARSTLPITLAVLVGTLPLLLNVALTGSPIATGAQAKSWLGNVPFRPLDILQSVAHNYRLILERFTLSLWATRPWFLAPGALLFAIAGWIELSRRRQWDAVALTLGWFTLGILATASLITATWHVGRYQVPFLALLVPLTALGFVALADRLPSPWRAPVVTVVTLGLLATTLVSSNQARVVYERAARTVARQQLVVADWIRRNLPPDANVGVHDTGAMRYVGGRPTYDMIGLTTQEAATPWRHGAGAAFERIENSPARPDYFATYPDAFSIPYLASTDLFADELFRANVPDFGVTSAGPVQAVYRADWHLAGSGDRPYQADILRRTQGLTLVDRLDLADLEDEAGHDLSFWEGVVRPGFPTEVQQFHYRADPTIEVLDGGRQVTGGLAFRMAAQAGQTLVLVARLHAAQAGAVRVSVDGHEVGLWRFPALPGEWLETVFLVPADAVTRYEVEIRLEVDTANPNFRHFSPYYLWAWAGEPVPLAPEPAHSLSARLGDAVELLGYDLPSTSSDRDPAQPYRPGETVQLMLYWRAVAPPADDAKVFVHLYDQSGEIVAQKDRRPYYGTRPPYTWSPGEALDDPYTLALPPDLPPGRYTLGLGMYDAITGTRLPVQAGAGHTLPDNRILLDTIDVILETE